MARPWIVERLKTLKKKKGGMAQALSITAPRVSDILNGKRRIQSHEIPHLSIFLELDMSTIIEHIQGEQTGTKTKKTTSTEQIQVVGQIRKRENNYKLWSKNDIYTITLPKQTAYMDVKKFALEEIVPSSTLTSLHICISKNDYNLSTTQTQSDRILQKLDGDEKTKQYECAVIIAKYQQHN